MSNKTIEELNAEIESLRDEVDYHSELRQINLKMFTNEMERLMRVNHNLRKNITLDVAAAIKGVAEETREQCAKELEPYDKGAAALLRNPISNEPLTENEIEYGSRISILPKPTDPINPEESSIEASWEARYRELAEEVLKFGLPGRSAVEVVRLELAKRAASTVVPTASMWLVCACCNKRSPIVTDEDEVIDAAIDAGWVAEGQNEEDQDLCPECQPAGRHTCRIGDTQSYMTCRSCQHQAANAQRMIGLVPASESLEEPVEEPIKEHNVLLEQGWKQIGLLCDAGRRSLWLRYMNGENDKPFGFELCAGREGGDAFVRCQPGKIDYQKLLDVIVTAEYGVDCLAQAMELAKMKKDNMPGCFCDDPSHDGHELTCKWVVTQKLEANNA